VLAGCELPRFGAPDPASQQGRDTLHLWQAAVIAALAVAALVWILVLTAAIHFRRRNDDIPSQSAHNTRIEAVYTAVPLVIVAVLFAATLRTEARVSEVAGQPDLEIDVVGFQWQWQFTYENLGVVVVGDDPANLPELVLPVGAKVRFVLRTNDVIHSFWVPGFLYKRDLIQGVGNVIDVDVDRVGTYDGRCAEFCGLDHYRMTFTVRVVEPDEFEQWLVDQGSSVVTESSVP
jgi:cytochrome c oxidase subunit 2